MPQMNNSNKSRGNGEGSVYKRDNRWIGQVQTGVDDLKKPIREYASFATRKEAASWVAMMTIKTQNSTRHANAADFIFKDVCKLAIDELTLDLTPRTMDGYHGAIRKYILPAFSDRILISITTQELSSFFSTLRTKHQLGPRAISQVKSSISVVYDYAVDLNIISDNPVRTIKQRKKTRAMQVLEKKSFSSEAIPAELVTKILFYSATNKELYPIIVLMLYSGLRIGELLALQWNHIDFCNSLISVKQAITEIITYDDNGSPVLRSEIIGPTKSASSVRTIPVPNVVIDTLKEWKELICTQCWSSGAVNSSDFVFVSLCNGKRRTYDSARSMYNRFIEKYNLPHNINFHRFRHTYATMLTEQSVSPKIIQLLLGHKDVKLTLDVYTTISSDMFENAITKLDIAAQALNNGSYSVML